MTEGRYYDCRLCHAELDMEQVHEVRILPTVGERRALVLEISYRCSCRRDGDGRGPVTSLYLYDPRATRRLTGSSEPPAASMTVEHERMMLTFHEALADVDTPADFVERAGFRR